MGCDIEVQIENGTVVGVMGNTCPRGKNYAINEVSCPKRVVTTTVKTENGKMVAVKTDVPVNKADMFKVIDICASLVVKTPIGIGDVIVENIFGGVNLVATSQCK
jgi:CxxC motif-containing protein